MISLNRKVLVCVVALVCISALATQGAISNAAEKTIALTFLEKVIGIDVEAYNLAEYAVIRHRSPDLLPTPDYPETSITFDISGGSGDYRIDVRFKEGILTDCVLRLPEGEPMLKIQYTEDLVSNAREFLQRYQVHFNVSYCKDLEAMLDEVAVERGRLANQSIIREGAILRIKSYPSGSVYFQWNYRVNDLNMEAPDKCLVICFRNSSNVSAFKDKWSIYKIGSTTVNLSEVEAIEIARNLTEEWIKTKNDPDLKIASITAGLALVSDESMERGDYLTLFPRWAVRATFNKPYEYTYGYAVYIWADTGEVDEAFSEGVWGEPETESSTPWLNPMTLTLILAPTAALAIAAILYKKRISKPRKPTSL